MINLSSEVQEIEVQRVIIGNNDFAYDRHEAITHVGGFNPPWLKPKDVVINEILSGRIRYFTRGTLLTSNAYLEVVKVNAFVPSTWYLRTRQDGTLGNNLLWLPGGQQMPLNRLAGKP